MTFVNLTRPLRNFTAFEELVTWSETAAGKLWNTEAACGKGAAQFVQVLHSDKSVLNNESPETSTCGIQDVTNVVQSYCGTHVSTESAACEFTMTAFREAGKQSRCAAANDPSMLVRFNCDPGELHSAVLLHNAMRYRSLKTCV